MKTILLVGKLNDLTKEIKNYLSGDFDVQLSSDNTEVLSGMLKVIEPDMVIICMVGMYDGHDAIFQKFQLDYPSVPVLTIGTKDEWERFSRYYTGDQFTHVIRPVKQQEVYEKVREILGTDDDREISEQKKRILVVDDHGPTLRNIKAMLDDVYDVSVAPSGAYAMTSIGKARPDLILLDYEMPVCDGKQTLEMIRAEEDIADIPVIFLTSVNDRKHIEAVLALHPSGYLLKPPVKERLLAEIERALSPSS